MIYYNKDNEEFDSSEYKYFSRGMCARVYKRDDILFKVYDLDCKYRLYLSKKMFKLLKELKIDNMVELIDFYHQFKSKILPMDAYTMKYVGGKDVDILTASKEYIVDIANQLDETITQLSEHKIVMHDAHRENILFKENGVTIIDPDQFYTTRCLTEKAVYERNKVMAILYLTDTITQKMREQLDDKSILYSVPIPYQKGVGLRKCLISCYKDKTIYDTIMNENR